VPVLTGVLLDPRVGLPVVLLAVAVVVWVAGRPSGDPVRRRGERAERAPDADPASRTYVAIRHGAYSEILDATYDRLDRAVDAKAGCHLRAIPWRARTARQMGLTDPKGLRKCREALDSLLVWAVTLETGSPLRWDFWRTNEASRVRFQRRLTEWLREVDHHLTALGFTP
jgi:hypothetical protein